MVVGWALVQATVNAGYASIMASIPDQVPRTQRGVVGGWVALAQTIGAMVGTGIAMATGGWAAGYLACAAFIVAASLPILRASTGDPAGCCRPAAVRAGRVRPRSSGSARGCTPTSPGPG